jgi:hypothetical protein
LVLCRNRTCTPRCRDHLSSSHLVHKNVLAHYFKITGERTAMTTTANLAEKYRIEQEKGTSTITNLFFINTYKLSRNLIFARKTGFFLYLLISTIQNVSKCTEGTYLTQKFRKYHEV